MAGASGIDKHHRDIWVLSGHGGCEDWYLPSTQGSYGDGDDSHTTQGSLRCGLGDSTVQNSDALHLSLDGPTVAGLGFLCPNQSRECQSRYGP